MTVSRVINGSSVVSEETRQRVQSGIAELGYIPNQLASGLSRRRTNTFGVIVPDIANPFWTHVVRGIEEVAWRAGRHVILCNTHADQEREHGYVNDMLAFQVDGVLIGPVGDQSRANLKLLTHNAVPSVLIDRSVKGNPADIVQGDSVDGARRIVKHLVDLGHRRIAIISDSSSLSTARDRLAGYKVALETADIDFAESLVVETSTVDSKMACEATLQLLGHAEPPTAIFAINSVAAIGVTEAADLLGLSIPQDISVACFDDDNVDRFRPFFTSIIQPAETFGTIATQLLLDRLVGHIDSTHRKVVLPAEMIVRGSTSARVNVTA
jgi:LacI family transcriptional regulator